VLGTGLFWSSGRLRALSIGLVSANRNVTLVWAAAGASLAGAPDVELFLAMSVFPIFMMPALTRGIVARLLGIDRRPLPTSSTLVAKPPPA
jgi:hypothetical protein